MQAQFPGGAGCEEAGMGAHAEQMGELLGGRRAQGRLARRLGPAVRPAAVAGGGR